MNVFAKFPVVGASVIFSPSSGTETATSPRHEPVTQKAEKPRALIVDDAPDIAEMLSILLRVYGYETETRFSAPEALEAACQKHYDVVISDIGMPSMNGYQLAEALRSMPEYRDTPLVAVTGFAEFSDKTKAMQAGFNEHLTKPVDGQKLIQLLAGMKI